MSGPSIPSLGLCPCGQPATKRINYRGGTHILVCAAHAWEYENDPDWLGTHDICAPAQVAGQPDSGIGTGSLVQYAQPDAPTGEPTARSCAMTVLVLCNAVGGPEEFELRMNRLEGMFKEYAERQLAALAEERRKDREALKLCEDRLSRSMNSADWPAIDAARARLAKE